ncbi:MAG: metallophosphoesterase [Planctomycetes bacterium]|nr:metallophosphoesterase [Planctomycetota bacterium]
MAEQLPTRRGFLKTAGAAVASGLAGDAIASGLGGAASQETQHTGEQKSQLGTGVLIASEAAFCPTADGCTVHWVPSGTVEAQVLAGVNPGELKLVRDLTTAKPTEMRLERFPPDSDLFWRCRFRARGESDWIVRPVRRMHTARAEGASFRVAVVADSHHYAPGRAVARRINLDKLFPRLLADRPDFIIFMGDEAGIHHYGRPPDVVDQSVARLRWASWRQVFSPLLADVPSFMVLGNHEGEAGYYQVRRQRGAESYLQRFGTVARKEFCRNPGPDTYPEGGENEGWAGDPKSAATGGASEGNRSPLENYFAWSWGDALFVVIDVHRYTSVGGSGPKVVEEWTLGEPQLKWLERTLLASRARWKFVLAHHVVGGSAYAASGQIPHGRSDHVYGRGGARYARVGEQARITDLMRRSKAQFFLYGHDHVFAHQQAEGIHFVCCGRPTVLSYPWWDSPGWREAYGDPQARHPHDFFAAVGYTRLSVSPRQVRIEYIRTGTDPAERENVLAGEGETVYQFSVS